jgi:hypothetical protein
VKVTADDIAQLLASRPPRQVPKHVAQAAQDRCESRTLVLISGGIAIAGLFIVGILFPWHWFDELRLKGASAGRATGVIQWVRESNLTVNKRRVYEFGFVFTPPGSGPVMTSCFATGRRWTKGESVAVRYLPSSPDVAIVSGGDWNKGGLTMAFVAIFPLAGFGIAFPAICRRRQVLFTLQQGHATEVEIKSVEAMKVSLSRHTVHRITVSAPADPGGPPVVLRRVDHADIGLATRHAANKRPVFVLYDPRQPSQMIFPETLIDQ